MRKLVAVLCLLVFFFSCKKEEKFNELLSGKWELRVVKNGMTGENEYHAKGNGIIISFSKNEYSSYSDGKVMKSGSYKIIKAKSILNSIEGNRIIYDNETESPIIFVEVKGNTLNLNIDAYDAPSMGYERIN